MRFSLRSLLFGAAFLPPMIAFTWVVIGVVEKAAANSRSDELLPFLQQAAAVAAVIAGATVIAALCHRMGTSVD
jgi:hypothetical protein